MFIPGLFSPTGLCCSVFCLTPDSVLMSRFHLSFTSMCLTFMFHSVTSGISRRSSGISSSTLSEPSHPPMSSFSLQTDTQPPGTARQDEPSSHANSAPTFARAHPPPLPKIFQSCVRSGTSPEIPRSLLIVVWIQIILTHDACDYQTV